MPGLAGYPSARRWPPRNPDAIRLCALPTSNGVKAGTAVEAIGLACDGHRIEFASNDQMSAEFLNLSPNTRIPAMLDPHGPDGQPLARFESGAILIDPAQKSGKFLPVANRYAVLQWLMFQMGAVGPMFGQPGDVHGFAGKEIEDPPPKRRLRAETARLVKVLDRALAGRERIAKAQSIADRALGPWLWALRDFDEVGAVTGPPDARNVEKYIDSFLERPAVQRGFLVPVTL